MSVPTQVPPPYVVRGLPGPGHEAMKALVGKWGASVTMYMALGSPDHPVASTDIITTRKLIGEGRYLHDTTSGTIAGQPYWRVGTLGYSNMDRRFEWVTQDGINSNMMIYLGALNSEPRFPTSMTGVFTDQGVLGEGIAGKVVQQRTVITIVNANEHVLELYFTPPGEPERIADRHVYTRIG